MTKEEQWRHARTHIPPEKQLTCELCEFVTEYKHHLEYHIRNHKGEKPFGCKECNYQCVNKSMLNSHMKSHNSLYQFKCMDCAYQTKYCHSLKMHLHKYNHRRAPGTVMSEGDANETDHFEDPSENGTSMALQQLSQQFRADPGVSSDDMQSLSNPVTSVRDTLRSILQPMVTSAPMQQQYAMQALRQQHIDRMQEMLRNANFNAMAMLPCQLCDFTTADRDELHRHQIAHVQQALASNNNPNLTGHPTLASLLANQNLQNGGPLMLPHLMPQQQQPLMAPNTLNSATLQQVNMLREHMARHYAANQDRSISDPQHSTALNHSSEYAAYGGSDERARPATETSHDADESSSSPTGSKMSVDESGSPASDIATDGTSRKRKQKKGKLEDTVKRLREKSSPESDEHEFSADSGHSDAAGSSTAIVASLPQPIPTSFFTSLSNTAPQERQRSSSAGYVCQHCAITFQDLALYQIHLGYHSFDNPFKCNRCGQVSPNSLQFNLHLYQ
ncbi:zinc finger protein, partial [Aphelenchoides avenae]